MSNQTIHSPSSKFAPDSHRMSPVAEAVVTGPTDLDVKVHKEPVMAPIDVSVDSDHQSLRT